MSNSESISGSSSLGQASGQQDQEIDLVDIARAIWSGKWLIIVITTVFTLLSVQYAKSVPDEYKSSALLVPVSASESSLTKLAGRLGGVASLGGINLGQSGNNNAVHAIELMASWDFLEKFVRENNLEVEVFAATGWDKAQNKLIIDPTVYDEQSEKWIKPQLLDGGVQGPSGWDLFQRLSGRVSVSQDAVSGLVQLEIEHYSPYIAQRWAELLIDDINKYFQLRDKKEAQSSIDYLIKQIEMTNVVEMRGIFYQLVEEKTKTLMLAEIGKEYVFKVLSPPKVAEVKSKPARASIVVLGSVAGLLLSLLIALVRYFKKIRSL